MQTPQLVFSNVGYLCTVTSITESAYTIEFIMKVHGHSYTLADHWDRIKTKSCAYGNYFCVQIDQL